MSLEYELRWSKMGFGDLVARSHEGISVFMDMKNRMFHRRISMTLLMFDKIFQNCTRYRNFNHRHHHRHGFIVNCSSHKSNQPQSVAMSQSYFQWKRWKHLFRMKHDYIAMWHTQKFLQWNRMCFEHFCKDASSDLHSWMWRHWNSVCLPQLRKHWIRFHERRLHVHSQSELQSYTQ